MFTLFYSTNDINNSEVAKNKNFSPFIVFPTVDPFLKFIYIYFIFFSQSLSWNRSSFQESLNLLPFRNYKLTNSWNVTLESRRKAGRVIGERLCGGRPVTQPHLHKLDFLHKTLFAPKWPLGEFKIPFLLAIFRVSIEKQ